MNVDYHTRRRLGLSPFTIVRACALMSSAAAAVSTSVLFSAHFSDISGPRTSPYHPDGEEVIRIAQLGATGVAVFVLFCSLFLFAVSVSRGAKFLLTDDSVNLVAPFKTAQNSWTSPLFIFVVTFCILSLSLPVISYLLVADWPLHAMRPRYASADRRWILAAYTFGWFGALVLPLIVRFGLEELYQDQASKSGVDLPRFDPDRGPNVGAAPGQHLLYRVILASVLAFLVFGPPWNVDLSPKPLNDHLMESMASFQAIQSGAIPYVGAAGYGYGPGMQLISYVYQMWMGELSVPWLRESYVLMNWVAATLYSITVFVFFGARVGIVFVIFLTLISPFILYEWRSPGYIFGYYGWASALRNIALPLVGISFAFLLLRIRAGASHLLLGFGLGLGWGFLAYVAQENAMLTLVAMGAIGALAVGGRIIDIRSAVATILAVIGGFAVVAVGVIFFYTSLGLDMEFVQNYRLIPSLTFAGVTGRYWSAGDPWGHRLVLLYVPLGVIGVGAAALLQSQPFRLVRSLSTIQFVVLALCIVTLLGMMAGLVRPSVAQIRAGTVGIPILVAVLSFVLFCRGADWQLRGAAVLFLVGLLMFSGPISFSLERIPAMAYARAQALGIGVGRLFGVDGNNRAVTQEMRLGPLLIGLSECCEQHNGYSGRALADFSTQLKGELGNRRAYLHSLPNLGRPGAMMFLADLVPAANYQELNTRFATIQAVHEHEDRVVEGSYLIDAMVTVDPDARLVRMFVAARPGVQEIVREFHGLRYYILLAEGRSAGGSQR